MHNPTPARRPVDNFCIINRKNGRAARVMGRAVELFSLIGMTQPKGPVLVSEMRSEKPCEIFHTAEEARDAADLWLHEAAQ